MINTVAWKALSCVFELTRTMIRALIGRWKKKESLKLVELMKENLTAWLASASKFRLTRFVGVWMPCVIRMVQL